MAMNSRQRVIRAIEMTGPDRTPIMHDTLPGAFSRYGTALEILYREYPDDVIDVGSATYGEFGPEIGTPSRDPWGSLWVRHTDEHKGQVTFCPLADWSALDTYRPPDTCTDEIITELVRKIRANAGKKYTLADGDTLWQRMYYLRGFRAANEDLLVDTARAARLRDMILEVILRRLDRLAGLDGLDGVHFRDDWGTQKALLIRPELWRHFFKPAYARMFHVVRQSGKHVWFHSDGVIDEIIPDLIDIGAHVINPQCNCMPRERLSELIAGKVCLLGDLDRQWTLPRGSPEDVRAAVRADIDTYGRFNGGLVARGEVAGDVPLANVEAMLDEVTRYGSNANTEFSQVVPDSRGDDEPC
jgi:uroporphyrinogen-III decarboxylase